MCIIYQTQNTPIHGWGCFVAFKSRRKDPDPLSALFAAPIRVKSGDLLKPPSDPAARLRGPRRPFTLFRRGSFSRFPLSRSRLLVAPPSCAGTLAKKQRDNARNGKREREKESRRTHPPLPSPFCCSDAGGRRGRFPKDWKTTVPGSCLPGWRAYSLLMRKGYTALSLRIP